MASQSPKLCIDCFAERRAIDQHIRCNSCHHKWRQANEPGYKEKQRAREAAYRARHPERWKMIHATAERTHQRKRAAARKGLEVNCSRCGLLDTDTICQFCRMEKAGIRFMDFEVFA